MHHPTPRPTPRPLAGPHARLPRRLRPRLALAVALGAALAACSDGHRSASADASRAEAAAEEDVADATSAGTGTGARRPLAVLHTHSAHADAVLQRAQALAAAGTGYVAGVVPPGPSDAHLKGAFSAPLDWPLMPIHMVQLPDGRILNYGSDTSGKQGGGLHYAVWDPAVGSGAEAFTVLPNETATDIFCAGQTLLPETGNVLIVGGTTQYDKERGYGNAATNVFDRAANTLVPQSPMAMPRWYPSVITLPDGRSLVMGGRDQKNLIDPNGDPLSVATYVPTPEIFAVGKGWRQLPGATSDDAYGANDSSWYYPRAWVEPGGRVFIASYGGKTFFLDASGDGDGTLTTTPLVTSGLQQRLPAVMYRQGKIWMMRKYGPGTASHLSIDLNGATPVSTPGKTKRPLRLYGNATVLADGQVWVNGGSPNGNELDGAELYSTELWNPDTNEYVDTASAALPRLYHSIAMLLPDGSVITGSGGDPGPVTNLNAEIWYPPYLFRKDGSGEPAPRPAIVTAPESVTWGQRFNVTMDTDQPVSKVTWVRTGVVTHDFNSNQRFQPLPFKQTGSTLKVTAPFTRGSAPPGYYLLFAFDAAGVPSIAKIVKML